MRSTSGSSVLYCKQIQSEARVDIIGDLGAFCDHSAALTPRCSRVHFGPGYCRVFAGFSGYPLCLPRSYSGTPGDTLAYSGFPGHRRAHRTIHPGYTGIHRYAQLPPGGRSPLLGRKLSVGGRPVKGAVAAFYLCGITSLTRPMECR